MNNNINNNIKDNENKKDRSNYIVKILTIILIILFLLSFIILTLRLGNFLSNNIDIFFIEPKHPEVIMGDDEKIWDGETSIDIFEIKYINDKGEVTVISGTGDKVIAPGTKGYYKFNFKNVGNIAVDYQCDVRISFACDNITFNIDKLPIGVKLKDYNGNYIIGSNDEYSSIYQLMNYSDSKTIGKNSYVYYELEWCWLFDSGNDVLDTYLGNMSANSSIRLVVDLSAQAVQSIKLDAEGGLPIDDKIYRTGGNIVPLPYILLNLIILIILIVLLLFRKKQREEKSKEINKKIENKDI